jgi:hypothetical protein
VNGTRKQTKKEETNKLTTLVFKMIHIIHNTLLATPKIKFFLGLLPNFEAPTNLPTTIFMGPNSNFTLGEFVLLGSLPNSNFTLRAFAHFGCPRLGFRGSKPNVIQGEFFLVWSLPKIKFYSGTFAHFGAHWRLLEFRAQNQILFRGLLPIVRVPNSNLTLGILPIFGPKLKFYSGAFAHFGVHWGLLGFRGPKSKIILGEFSFW